VAAANSVVFNLDPARDVLWSIATKVGGEVVSADIF
jgi:hypothetical protein